MSRRPPSVERKRRPRDESPSPSPSSPSSPSPLRLRSPPRSASPLSGSESPPRPPTSRRPPPVEGQFFQNRTEIAPAIVSERTSPALAEIESPLFPPRLKSFLDLTRFLATIGVDLCNLDFSEGTGKAYQKKAFGKGDSGDAYRLFVDPRGFAVKAMKSVPNALREVEFHQLFTTYALTTGFPHFPLISRVVECNRCRNKMIGTSFELSLEKIKDQRCLLMFSELANGDATTFFKEKRTFPESLSFLGQVLMASLVLEKRGIGHNDLRLDNILYHSEEKEEENKGKWFHYGIDGQDYFIQHTGQLWVLWDFGMMDETPSTFDNDIAMTFAGLREAGRIPLLRPFLEVDRFRGGRQGVQKSIDRLFRKGLPGFSQQKTEEMTILNSARYDL